MTNTSIGPIKFYGRLTPFIISDRKVWRKVARLLGKLRRHTHNWGFVNRENQLKCAEIYAKQALRDTILPAHVTQTLRFAINAEFHFSI